MDTDVIVFTALKLKKDNPSFLPQGVCGWTSYDECSILCSLLENKFKQRVVISMYYLDRYNYKVEEGKIKPLKKWEEINQDYIICFSIDMLNAIFYDQEFVKSFLSKILELYINEHQKFIDQAAVCLDKIKTGQLKR